MKFGLVILMAMVLSGCAVGGKMQPALDPVRINDSGITSSQCYQSGSSVLADCNSAAAKTLSNTQDGMLGRDTGLATNTSSDGKLGFSFNSVPGGCVLDNVTGLMWEVKTSDGGLRDQRNVYTYFSPEYDPGLKYRTATDAMGYVDAVNATSLCGYNDWRLPTVDELQSLVDYSVANPGPTIDTVWFPDMQGPMIFWADPLYHGYTGVAWSVGFTYGFTGYNDRERTLGVRLVRAGHPTVVPRYTVSADGQEVTDNQTRLIWRRCAEGMVFKGGTCRGVATAFLHETALQLPASPADKAKGWRLPNVKELASITEKGRSEPAIDPAAFPRTPSNWFWSASPYVGNPQYTWCVNFATGAVNQPNRDNTFFVRLVRSAP